MTNPTDGNASGGGETLVEPCNACDPPPRIRLRAGLYFDGTLNNRTNVGMGQEGNTPFPAALVDLGSYSNDFSNVSKLEESFRRYIGVDAHTSVYVEGIGTQDARGDVPEGMALGTGITGVKAKVRAGLRALENWVVSTAGGQEVEFVHVDTFGFSRGAAAARHCVWKALQDAGSTLLERLTARGLTVGEVRVRFVGLFDTVASYGWNHEDDTADLNLDAIAAAERTVQLAAADEHRKNFSLTNIDSAGGSGLQLFLPGAHSDVGGGYNDGASETDLYVFEVDSTLFYTDGDAQSLHREIRWLREEGWYTNDEIFPAPRFVKVTRGPIANGYTRIPLGYMAEYAQETGWRASPLMAQRHSPPADLADVKARLDQYRSGVGGVSQSRPGDWFGRREPWLKTLRHDHLHFSAHYGGVGAPHAPKFTNDDRTHGRRERVIHAG